MEVEGGGQNVRVFNNFIEHTNMMIANAATSIGPLYVWNNVTGASYTPKGGNGGKWDMVHGNFMKMGWANSEKFMTGQIYVFNNTIFQGPENNASDGPGGDSRIIKHSMTRNNIFHVRPTDTNSISTNKSASEDNDFDYDLISARVPANSESHGVKSLPKYVIGAGFNEKTMTGNFELAPDSPGKGKGVVIPNFCEPANGKAPDVGVRQPGPAMVYGVKAEFVPPPRAKPGK
jgi:hypothetical protein